MKLTIRQHQKRQWQLINRKYWKYVDNALKEQEKLK